MKYTVTTRSGSVYELTNAADVWYLTGIRAAGKGSSFVGITVRIVPPRIPAVGGYLDLYRHSDELAWPRNSREFHTSRIVDIQTEDA